MGDKAGFDNYYDPKFLSPNRSISAKYIHSVPGFEYLCWAQVYLKKGCGGEKEIIKYLGRYVQDFNHTLKSNGGIQFEHGFISRDVSLDTAICPTECRSRSRSKSKSRSRSKSPSKVGGRRLTKKARKFSLR